MYITSIVQHIITIICVVNRLASVWQKNEQDTMTLSVSESDEAFRGYYDSLQDKISQITVLDELLAGMFLHTHLCLSIMK